MRAPAWKEALAQQGRREVGGEDSDTEKEAGRSFDMPPGQK